MEELGKQLIQEQKVLSRLQTKKQSEKEPARKARIQLEIDAQHELIRNIKRKIKEA